MNALTVEQLYKYFKKEMEKGHQDYIVFVTDDEEGNGYHCLWYIGQTPTQMTKENRQYSEDANHDLCVLSDKDKAIYIG